MNNDTYNKTLSQNLKAIRKNKGLTTIDLAKILGVSQAKISYIEHGKGVLSARDIAVLARKLDIPVTDFFRGLDKDADSSEQKNIAGHLVHYGASHLAKSSGTILKALPFEEVFSHAFEFVEDDRLHKAFCAALIIQAATKGINTDRIFALTGSNPFLLYRIAEEAQICLQIIEILNRKKKLISPRAKRQISKIFSVAEELVGKKVNKALSIGELSDLALFVGECLHAKK